MGIASLIPGCVMALTIVETTVMNLVVLVRTKNSVATTRNVFPTRGPVTARMTARMVVTKHLVKVKAKIIMQGQEVTQNTNLMIQSQNETALMCVCSVNLRRCRISLRQWASLYFPCVDL